MRRSSREARVASAHFPAGHTGEITITINDREILDHLANVEVRYKSDDNRDHAGTRLPFAGKKLDFHFADGKAIGRINFHGAQSHTLNFFLP